ncbi:hypothetical protein AMTR_s00026p00135840 [Amborella trichopoda]|uniref:Uncharacterized protein n=1 Tax=Amborella trichopoda TaxID=13333 RepID=W1PQQ2_AMBTC|nr:hypothetical protein AMTR_s00026p00135840 [Amborella trichopoda]
MLKIVGMKAMFRGLGEARKLLADISFFANGSPFLVGGPTDNVYRDAFGEVFNGLIKETKKTMYFVSVRGCILPFRGMGDRKMDCYFPNRFARQHGLDQGCCFTILFKNKYGKKGVLQDHEAPGVSREAWIDLNMRMAWETCLNLTELCKFVIPHYGLVSHATETYWRWWNVTNHLYWRSEHPWKAINSDKCDDKAGKRFAPPSFSKFLS